MQYMYLMLWLTLGTGITVLPFSIAQFTVRDGWMVPLFYFFGVLLVIGVAVLFIRTFPNQSLMNGLETAFGPWVGRALGMWLVIWLLVHSGMLLRELSVFVEITSLPRTPLYLITATIVVPIAYSVFHGIEVMGRLSEFITPISILLALTLALLALQNVDFSQLRPVLADGWTPVLRASVLPATFPFQFLVSLQFVKSLNGGKTMAKDLLFVGVFLLITGALIEGIIISILGPAVSYLSLPVGEAVRGIRIGEFVQRLDTIYVMGAIATMALKIMVFVYVMSSILKDMFRLPTTRHVAWSAGIASWTANVVLFHNAVDLNEFVMYTTPAYYGFTLVGLPLLAVGVYRLTRVMSPQRRAGPT